MNTVTHHTHQLTALCLMSNARAARYAIRTGRIMDAYICLATIYNIAAYAACLKIVETAVEEAMRIETEIRATNAGRKFTFSRPDAKVIPFPKAHRVIVNFPSPTTTH